ncbi:CRISPR-associated protein Cas4 [Pelodictyon luteolum]|uniref:CRISPR-associated exonuclease Cas4 n=1 Tax=Chlorobium luteolum (strain DSM 273 / BCRC 81028 / 2530) TaxID=319225 RepID=Q3B3C2_CHLL3|nr:CRISPR-associated protein Cas4 [Pelodictyon luteolum]ABB24159.1 CRISPR-associated exonuclease, Cas4 family [Pelodictyon luteolum DSM 273]
MYAASDFIALSALQHFVYCPRQCALIHIEQVWAENSFTAEGRVMHERVDDGETSYRSGVRTTRSVLLRSSMLGASGIADVVEWHKSNSLEEPFPIEYKRGRQKKHDADKVQLCAQAICLEEMLNLTIPAGALFYGQTKRRFDVTFDSTLRAKTVSTAECVHELFRNGVTPLPEPGPKCTQCSLQELCLPKVVAHNRSAKEYVHKLLHELSEGEI